MTDETSIAFAPLDCRSESEADSRNDYVGDPLDRISVRDYVVEVEIGAFQVEREVTQRLSFSVVVEVAPSTGAVSDDVDDILSYDSVTEAIEVELSVERLNLLETLAQRIATRILLEPQSQKVFIRIEKLDRGSGKLGVEIVRTRVVSPSAQSPGHAVSDFDLNAHNNTDAVTDVVVVLVRNNMCHGPEFLRFLERLKADDRAYVLCVEPIGAGVFASGGATQAATKGIENHTVIARHIDLLSIEQNAWRLSAFSSHCEVVATLTELDWGIKHNQLSVWAPSKLVTDAVDMPESTDPLTLAAWLAHRLQAREVLCLGDISGAVPSAFVRMIQFDSQLAADPQ